MYGQPITLHYEGEDTFKTCPGGLISMVLLLIIICYALIKGKSMLKREDWSLTQQTVVSSLDELNQPYDIKDESYSNISISLQFYERKAKQTKALRTKAVIKSTEEKEKASTKKGSSTSEMTGGIVDSSHGG